MGVEKEERKRGEREGERKVEYIRGRGVGLDGLFLTLESPIIIFSLIITILP